MRDVESAETVRLHIDEARAAVPGVVLADDVFAAFLADKLEGESGPESLAKLRVTDLFLACACARQDPIAIARFEERYRDEVAAAYRRFPNLPVSHDDVVQRMRERLFFSDPPAIASYAGRGDLRAWVRAATVHLLLNIASRETRERPTDDVFFDAVVDADPNAEAGYLKLACRAEFEASFAAALASLTSREKMLLRYAYADGLSVDGIGAVFRVHRATAARWVAAARTKLVEYTYAELVARLDIDPLEAESIVRAALSGVGTTLLRKLGGGDEAHSLSK